MIKKKQFIVYKLMITLLLIVIFSHCSNDDVVVPNNPINGKTSAIFNPNMTYGTLIDQEGNIYKTITIGTQVWMAENLRTTKYRNGDPIPEVKDSAKWNFLDKAVYCNYRNMKNVDSLTTFGRLYTWYVITDNRNVAPIGWHVPNDKEWTILKNYLIANGYNYDNSTIENKVAKSMASVSGWENPLAMGWSISSIDGGIGIYPELNNKSGFTAMPGGYRSGWGDFNSIGYSGHWWSASDGGSKFGANSQSMYCYRNDIENSNVFHKSAGLSIRCVRD